MGLFSKWSKRPLDPTSLTTLWAHAEHLPDPWDAEIDSLVAAFLVRVGDQLVPFLDEYRQAFELLDTRMHAQNVQPYPWRGPDEPFVPRRFALARERLINQGQDAFVVALAEPARMALIETGPDLTTYDVMAGCYPEELAYLIEVRGGESGQLPPDRRGVTMSSVWPGESDDPDLKFDWDYDPEAPCFDLLCDTSQVPRFLNLELSDELAADLTWAERFSLVKADGSRSTIEILSDHLTFTAGAMVVDALGPLKELPSRGVDLPELVVEMGTAWRELEHKKSAGTVSVDLAALLDLPADAQRSTLAGIIAVSLSELVPRKSPERAKLALLAEGWHGQARP